MDKRELARMFSAQPKKYYQLSALKNQGFERRQCPKCKGWFWSLGKETCGDTVCEGGYKFIGKRDMGWDFLTAIEKWERFFEKNKHKVVEPYPLVARWRDDLHFVIASIADFQPWVMQGIAEPPGNPLVISQPCIRFNDLDNVGRTGRHMSMFFMGGQHAFNLHDYWQNETIHFGFRFLKEELNIPAEEITYKEDVWRGGGNFGPSVEAFVDGLEIVNHVFMQFEEVETHYREMDRKVVDTGWGLERISWYASGKANQYEAIFPNSAKLRHDLGIEVDFLDPFWSKLGVYDIQDGVKLPKDMKEKIAKMKPLHDLYTILDHTRALSFALADGAIPSNVGGGYNLRVLLRRVFSIIEDNKWDITPQDLIKNHAKYFSKRFKNMKELPDVVDIVGIENKRYAETKKSGKELIIKYLKKGIIENKLTELYESHGVPPEMVKEIAKENGKDLEIPDDFYLKIDKSERKAKVTKKIRDIPETKVLYYDRPPEETLETVVVWSEGNEVAFEETQFYPTGGGQIHDTGVVMWNDKSAKVINVYKEGHAVVHVLDKEAPYSGAKIIGNVDAKRRRDIMRHHTAVHIVNGAAYKVLGKHVWQAGADKTQEKARLDITHYKPITKDEVRKIEKIANEIVIQNIKVRKMVMNRTEAEQRFGFRLYQGGAVPGAKLRTINLQGHDAEACGGTHCDYTGEIGQIKITDTKRIQDGVVRIGLIAGMRSVEKSWHDEDLIRRVAEKLDTGIEDILNKIDKLERRAKKTKTVTSDSKMLIKEEFEGNNKIKFRILKETPPLKLLEKNSKMWLDKLKTDVIVSFVNKQVFVVSKGKISAVKVARSISKELGADAGGTEITARGGVKDTQKARIVIQKIIKKFE